MKFCSILFLGFFSIAANVCALDGRTNIITVNTPRPFAPVSTKAEWNARALSIRNQILVSCGLWPLPEKTPLKARVFGKVERDGYSIEKVYFQSYPGFYVAGNLYRPLGRGTGPFPGILNPHGHWDNGRMADLKEGSIAARCINFARQGMIAFSYDMVGYNDTCFPEHAAATNQTFYQQHRQFATDPTNMLWNISLMGLQTWNSIRALDFLETLPDVDKTRLACTGESGGGTQTYILGAIDERLSAQAPVVMVSHTMQGGCSCENVSGLRVHYSNVDIAACAAPRPQIIVGATGDWTRETLKVEGPAIESVYRLFGATDNLRYVMFDFRHNYNQTSREAVYDFFGKWLRPAFPASTETPYTREHESDLRVFPDRKLPADAISAQALITALVDNSKKELGRLKPTDRKSFAHFKEAMLPAWERTLQVNIPPQATAESVYLRTVDNHFSEKLMISRKGGMERIPTLLFSPEKGGKKVTVILAHPDGKAALVDRNGEPVGLAKSLLEKNVSVLLIDTFLTGEVGNPELATLRSQQVELFFSTYNKSDMQERVQDLVTAAAYAKNKYRHKVVFCGVASSGLWSLLAAPAADAVVADGATLASESDATLLRPDIFVPGIKKLGGFDTAASLAAPNSLLLHNMGDNFGTEILDASYNALKASKFLRRTSAKLSDAEIAAWVADLK